MEPETVRNFYDAPHVVDHYRDATNCVGLWRSEEKVFTRLFRKEETLLELGCGTGRIALGLWEIGYRNLLGIDFSKEMITEARRLNKLLEAGVAFQRMDATRLTFEDGLFAGAIFGFNGLMQIPGRDERRQALSEIHRVLQPDAWFAFTTHDRENPKFRKFWKAERRRWNSGKQAPELVEFGDRYESTPLGDLFIHVPTRREIMEDLDVTGFRFEADVPRSTLARESLETQEFSDECRFWVAQRRADPTESTG